jgi:hypothetical protein
MALGSTQPLTEMSTRKFPGVNSGRRVGLATSPPCVKRLCRKFGSLTSSTTSYRDSFSFVPFAVALKAKIMISFISVCSFAFSCRPELTAHYGLKLVCFTPRFQFLHSRLTAMMLVRIGLEWEMSS